MGHVVFIVLHVLAVLFFPLALWVTIPAHLIYGVVAGRRNEVSPLPATRLAPQRKCPACAELVMRDAFACKHCGADIVAAEVKAAIRPDNSVEGLAELPIVGESRYQRALTAIREAHDAQKAAGAYLTAELIGEPENPADRNAIRVEICGYTVGYLARPIAAKFHDAARREFNLKGPLPTITTPVEIRGTEHLGVFLYINQAIVDEVTA